MSVLIILVSPQIILKLCLQFLLEILLNAAYSCFIFVIPPNDSVEFSRGDARVCKNNECFAVTYDVPVDRQIDLNQKNPVRRLSEPLCVEKPYYLRTRVRHATYSMHTTCISTLFRLTNGRAFVSRPFRFLTRESLFSGAVATCCELDLP